MREMTCQKAWNKIMQKHPHLNRLAFRAIGRSFARSEELVRAAWEVLQERDDWVIGYEQALRDHPYEANHEPTPEDYELPPDMCQCQTCWDCKTRIGR